MTPNSLIRRLLLAAMVLAGPAWVFAPLLAHLDDHETRGVPSDERESGRRWLSRLKKAIEDESYDRTSAHGKLLLPGAAHAMKDALESIEDLPDVVRVRLAGRLETFTDDDTRELMHVLGPALDRVTEDDWSALVASGARGLVRALGDPFARVATGAEWVKSMSEGLTEGFAAVDVRKLPGDLVLVHPEKTSLASATNAATALRRRGSRGALLDLRGLAGGDLQFARALIAGALRRDTRVGERSGPTLTTSPEPILAGSGDVDLEIPIVTLVDGTTAGAAELVAGALRRAATASLIVGAGTRGLPLLTENVDLAAEKRLVTGRGWVGGLVLSTSAFRFTDGVDLMGRGLQPDVRVAGESAPSDDPAHDAILARGVLVLLAQLDIDPSTIPEYRDLK